MRDGLLVGTEVFPPGQYSVGSALTSDLCLDDPKVAPTHAYLFFKNGKAAVQDAGHGPIFVNGHNVTACELRPVDELLCGPFNLKVRVVAQKAPHRSSPSSAISEILQTDHPPQGGPRQNPPASEARRAEPPPPAHPPAQAPIRPGVLSAVPLPGAAVAPVRPPSSTVLSARRSNAAPSALEAMSARAPHLRPVENLPAEETRTNTEAAPSPAPAVALDFDPSKTVPAHPHEAAGGLRDQPTPVRLNSAIPMNALPSVPSTPLPLPPTANQRAPAQRQPAQSAQQAAQSAQSAQQAAKAPAAPAAKVAQHVQRAAEAPMLPSSAEARGKPRLFVETYWGRIRRSAGGFAKFNKQRQLLAHEDDGAALPLWGFGLEGKEFVFSEKRGDVFRVYVPPRCRIERRANDGRFYAVEQTSLETGSSSRRCINLGNHHAIRFIGEDGFSVVAYVQPALPRPFVSPLRQLPWLVLANLAIFGTAFLAFVLLFAEVPESADFNSKTMNPVAVKLIAPPKPEEKKKLEEKVEKLVKKEKQPPPKAKDQPKAPSADVKKAIKNVEKLTAAGPAIKDLLAAVDKLGSGPGAKNAKNDFKLSGLLGKQPIANAGLGAFGLGGGGGGGLGIKGAELLRGKGGGSIGALGAGNIGKGAVAGTVTRAVSRNVGTQGSIDKEAVAKVINSHLAEVSGCYERALLKTPGLAGKVVLEWQITTAGTVGFAKTKSSTMQSAAVEACILTSLKDWKFPSAKGSGVLITYPFMFNSVGY
jgi:hypothetical protein